MSQREPTGVSPFCTIEVGASIADGVEVFAGAYVCATATLEPEVSVGPNAVVGSRPDPSADPKATNVLVRRGATIGPNATVGPGVTIGTLAHVQAGAVVLRSVPPKAIVAGNPAQIIGYVDSERRRANDATDGVPAPTWKQSSVQGVSVHRLPLVRDLRGQLTVGEFGTGLPFVPARYFVVFDVPSREVRGEHAHRVCSQFLVCLRGQISIVVDDGTHREEYRLTDPATGLHLPPMVWGIQYQHTDDALLLVFASHSYDADDYIRDYDEFLAEVKDSEYRTTAP